MDNKKINNYIKECLDNLNNSYQNDNSKEFIKLYKSLIKAKFKDYLKHYLEFNSQDELEYFDNFQELSYFYNLEKNKNESENLNDFTLRNPEDLVIFEKFLDQMIRLLELSPLEFLKTFPKCPLVFWDKIDDLRETSYKVSKDSEEYSRCLFKCKKISYAFSELIKTKENDYE